MPFNKNELKKIFVFLNEELFNLEDPCRYCDDIDCEKCYLRDMLKKKHILDIVDWKWCLKNKKKELKVIKALWKKKEFEQFRKRECYVCKKEKLYPEEFRKGFYSIPIELKKFGKCFELVEICKKCKVPKEVKNAMKG